MHRQNIYDAFFTLLKEIYTLYAPAHYTYCNPLFGTWTPPTTKFEKTHHMTILQGSDSDSVSDAGPSSVPIGLSTLNDIPPSIRQIYQSNQVQPVLILIPDILQCAEQEMKDRLKAATMN